MEFKKGQIIKLKNRSYIYWYDSYAKDMGLEFYKNNSEKPLNAEVGVIVGIRNNDYYGIRINGSDYVIHRNGLELIGEQPKADKKGYC